MRIFGKSLEWAGNDGENQITIVYVTMRNGTKSMAEAIAKGLQDD